MNHDELVLKIDGLKIELDKIKNQLIESKKEYESRVDFNPPSPIVWNKPKLNYTDANCLNDPSWPVAIPVAFLALTEEDKVDRAEAIISITGQPTGKRFLDFGCGEAHVVKRALRYKPQLSVGYDPFIAEQPTKEPNLLITNNLDKVAVKAPYDIILVHDVLDHVENPLEVLKQIRRLSDRNTLVFIRCHPFVSRSGGHAYKTLNKAYAHLMTDCVSEGVVFHSSNPELHYNTLFANVGFKVEKVSYDQQPVEDWLIGNSTFVEQLNKVVEAPFPAHVASQTIFDYTLKWADPVANFTGNNVVARFKFIGPECDSSKLIEFFSNGRTTDGTWKISGEKISVLHNKRTYDCKLNVARTMFSGTDSSGMPMQANLMY